MDRVKLRIFLGRSASFCGMRSSLVLSLLFLVSAFCSLPYVLHAQTELGSEDDLTVLGADGTVPDPDVEIKGFSIFGSTNVLTHISTAPGNVVMNGALEVSSNVYIVGFSSANRYYGDGSSLTGISGDNLGNHIATTTLQMGAYGVNTSSNITAARYQINGSTMVAILPGTDSIAYGAYAGMSNVAGGNYNIFLGNYAGQSNTTGWGNSFLGYSAGQSNTTGANNTFLGNNVGQSNTTGDQNTFLGNAAGQSNTTGGANSFLGFYAGRLNTTGWGNSFLGNAAGYSNTTGYSNSFLGYNAGQANTTGAENTFLGYLAGQSNTTGVRNSFLGNAAGLYNTGSDNSFLGNGAGQYNTTGWGNSFLGSGAGYANTTAIGNSFLGFVAGRYNTTGDRNSFLGYQAGYYTVSGAGNAIVGYNAGGYGAGAVNSFSSSTIMGYQAGYNVTTGNDNILLGWQAGYNVNTGIGNIVIGYNKDTSAPAANNELNIGGVLYGDLYAKTIGISTRAPQAALDIVSTGTAANIYAQIWRKGNGDIVSSMSAAGVMMAARFLGDGSSLTGISGDNLGNHIATATLQMGAYGVNTSSNITAARYQINGSTMVAILPGTDSIAYGVYAGTSNIAGGNYNIFIGNYAGQSNTMGFNNSFLGYQAGYSNTTGARNSFLGNFAGYNTTTGYENSFLGYAAGWSNTTGWGNSFLGYSAGYSNTTAIGNSFLGYFAGYNNTTGDGNSFLGFSAGYSNTTGGGNSFLGNYAGKSNTTGFSNSFFGNFVGYSNTTGARNSFFGNFAGYDTTTGNDNSFLGSGAGRYNTTGYNNSFLGSAAGQANTTGAENSFLGAAAGASNTTGGGNSFLGSAAGQSNTSGYWNSFLGYAAGASNTTGYENAFFGYQTGRFNTTGARNFFLGSAAGYSNTTGDRNSFLGYQAGYYTVSGAGNAIVGYNAGGYGAGAVNSFSSSTIMGYQAGYNVTTGNDNILLGWQAGYNVNTGIGNIVIGYNKDTSAPAANNELNIGGVLYGDLYAKTIGISTRAPQAALDIVSTGTAANIYAQIWRDGSGAIVSSMTSTGILYPQSAPAGDNLGSHLATTTLNMANFPVINVSSMAISGTGVTGSTPLLQIAGSTMVVLNNGNVGIGTTNPGEKLVVAGNLRTVVGGDSTGILAYDAAVGGSHLSSLTRQTNNLSISSYDGIGLAPGATGGPSVSYALFAKTGGNIGIGTISPQAELHVSSNNAVASSTVLLLSSGTNTGQELFIVKGNGNIGIGTAGPGVKLEVVGADNYQIARVRGSGAGVSLGSDASGNGLVGNTAFGSVMSITPSGNVGIGTTNPTSLLTVGPSGVIPNALTPRASIETAAGFPLYVGQPMAQGIMFGYDGASDIQGRNNGVNSDVYMQRYGGNVGIGTAVPGYKLEVNGSFNAASVYSNGVLLSPGTGSNWTVSGGDVYRSSGKVGIGTASPGTALSVVGAIQGDNLIRSTGGSANGAGAGAEILMSDGLASFWGYNRTTAADVAVQVGRAGAATTINGSTVSFMSGNVGIGTTGPLERLHVAGNVLVSTAAVNPILFVSTTTGNVGIGTTSPGQKMDVRAGTGPLLPIAAYGDSAGRNIGLFTYDFVSGSAGSTLRFNSGAGGNTYFSLQGYTAGENSANGNIVFNAGGGNVGIGTTNPGAKLHVSVSAASATEALRLENLGAGGQQSSINFSGVSGGVTSLYGGPPNTLSGQSGFALKLSDNSGNANNFIVADGESYSNYLAFWTGSSAVATNTEKMRITKEGNVGIGTTGPGDKLHVKGNVRIEAASGNYCILAISDTTTCSSGTLIGTNANRALCLICN